MECKRCRRIEEDLDSECSDCALDTILNSLRDSPVTDSEKRMIRSILKQCYAKRGENHYVVSVRDGVSPSACNVDDIVARNHEAEMPHFPATAVIDIAITEDFDNDVATVGMKIRISKQVLHDSRIDLPGIIGDQVAAQMAKMLRSAKPKQTPFGTVTTTDIRTAMDRTLNKERKRKK